MNHIFLAQSNPAALAEAIGPIIVSLIVFGIPIIAILVKHQQKMAMIYREDLNRQQTTPQLDILRRDVDDLKATVNQQMIMLDEIATRQRELLIHLKNESSLEERLRS